MPVVCKHRSRHGHAHLLIRYVREQRQQNGRFAANDGDNSYIQATIRQNSYPTKDIESARAKVNHDITPNNLINDQHSNTPQQLRQQQARLQFAVMRQLLEYWLFIRICRTYYTSFMQ